LAGIFFRLKVLFCGQIKNAARCDCAFAAPIGSSIDASSALRLPASIAACFELATHILTAGGFEGAVAIDLIDRKTADGSQAQ